MKNTKKLGIVLLIPSILITLGSFTYTLFVIASIGIYITWYSPAIFVAIALLLFSIFTLWISWRYIKNKPFRKNRYVGTFLILLGVICFLYMLIPVIYSNVTQTNPGGWARPIIGLTVGLFFILLGMKLIKIETKNIS